MEKNIQYQLESKLNERIKELECLYAITQLSIKNSHLPLEQTLVESIPIIQKAWQFPNITEVCITYDSFKPKSKKFDQGVQFQKSALTLNDENVGSLTIAYTVKKKEEFEGPFLKEERALIDKLALELSSIIERYENKKEKVILERKLRHSDRLATLGELIAGIAHEMNEPLGSILGFAQLIESENRDNEQLLKDVSKIIKASLHSREVIRKLMMFSKFDEKENGTMNINDTLKNGLYLLENRCAKENIKIVKILDDHLPDIYANETQLKQVIVNLMVNAIHALPNGGQLILQTSFDAQGCYLIIQDDGVGIAENHIRKIFDPFFTTKEVNTSTGLGLSVVHGIIDSMKGTISVESHLGVGTRFEIFIPL